MSTPALRKIARRQAESAAARARVVDKAALILARANPVQRALITDERRYVAGRCPRRAGKTHAVTSKILHLGESRPGSRVLVISLTLKSTVENYWSGAPGGLWAQNAAFDLKVKFNSTYFTWVHPNGSRGMLAGAETKADIEKIRGAAAEADMVVVDECKSFAPGLLAELLESVVEPGLMTRDGQLVLIGTPGSIPLGHFYRATCVAARIPGPRPGEPERTVPTCIPFDEWDDPGPAYADMSEEERGDMFSLHTWTIADNVAVPGQWDRALSIKRRNGWGDDHPTWRREYLGEWVSDESDLVYAYARARADGLCHWRPNYDHGVTGLDPREGPWHLLLGIDIGFVDDSAFVLVAWSETLQELRHVYDHKAPGMDVGTFTEHVLSVLDLYGTPEAVVADVAGGGAKMLVETLNQRYGLAIVPAVKTDKAAHIELVNADFLADRLKLIDGSDLAHELEGLQWDLSAGAKQELARTGRLREDPRCPNHLADALLYIWRHSYHFFSSPRDRGPAEGTPAWHDAREAERQARAVARRGAALRDPFGLARIERTPVGGLYLR